MLFFPPSFFQDGLKAVESLKPSIETLSTDLHTVSNFPPKWVLKVCTMHLDLNVAPVWCHVCMPHSPERDCRGAPPWSVGNRVSTLSSVFAGEGFSCRDMTMSFTISLHLSYTFSALLCFLKIKQAQDEERRQLIQLRDILKSALQVEQKEVRGFKFERSLFDPFTP